MGSSVNVANELWQNCSGIVQRKSKQSDKSVSAVMKRGAEKRFYEAFTAFLYGPGVTHEKMKSTTLMVFIGADWVKSFNNCRRSKTSGKHMNWSPRGLIKYWKEQRNIIYQVIGEFRTSMLCPCCRYVHKLNHLDRSTSACRIARVLMYFGAYF